jgi:hypothetical protein
LLSKSSKPGFGMDAANGDAPVPQLGCALGAIRYASKLHSYLIALNWGVDDFVEF